MLREHDVIESGDDCGKLHFLIDRVEHHREEFERTGGDVSGTVTARSPGLSAVDAVLLGILSVVWVRNYRTVGSGMTAGPGFTATMPGENVLAIVFFSTGMPRRGSDRPTGGRRASCDTDSSTRRAYIREGETIAVRAW